MAVSEKDGKVLWVKAAGHCSAPHCHKNLVPLLAKSGNVAIGNMAHIIGRRPKAARSDSSIGEDNSYDNLILLCPTDHTLVDKAEADYPPSLLRKWKKDWEEKVAARLIKRVSVTGGDQFEDRLWTYFNFDLILKLYRTHFPNGYAYSMLPDLQVAGVVNQDGFPLEGKNDRDNPQTIFDTWPQVIARGLRELYSVMVQELIHKAPPMDFDEIWGINKFKALLYPTAIGFVNRRCIFKPMPELNGHEKRRARCIGQGVELTFQVDTWNMFGSSPLGTHFRGTSRIMALLYIRSVERPEQPRDRVKLEVKATPIALGTGYWPTHDRTPDIASCVNDDDIDF